MPNLVAYSSQCAAGQQLPDTLRGEPKNARSLRRSVGEVLRLLCEAHEPKKNRDSHERRCSCSEGAVSLPCSSEGCRVDSRGSEEESLAGSSSGMRCVSDMRIVSLRSSSCRRKSIWSSKLRVYLSKGSSWSVLD